MEHDAVSAADPETLLRETRNAMITENGEIKPLTLLALELLDSATKTGHPDSYFLTGLLYHEDNEDKPTEALKWNHRAEREGCKHTYMYYFLGLFYSDRRVRVLGKKYFESAIGGKCDGLTLSSIP